MTLHGLDSWIEGDGCCTYCGQRRCVCPPDPPERDRALEPMDLPQSIRLAEASGMTYEVTIVDDRGEYRTYVSGCQCQDDALAAVVPYVNSNFLHYVRIRNV